jgi:protoporphyrinogen oxidase
MAAGPRMEHFKYIILGAGPSGLAFAHTLRERGEESFLVLEKEAAAGGLCRSAMVDGAPLDIGGGHFLDLKRKEVLELLFRFMPREEWQEHDRVSKIRIRGIELDHPLEANLWQLPVADQIDFLESIAKAGVLRGEPKPEGFADWITWKLGECIAREYMLPYNRKIWSMDPNALGTYWLYKLPDVSFRETLQSCLEHRPFGALPAHATFLYPREHGYGEVWRRMGEALGDQLHLGEALASVEPGTGVVNGRYQAERIVNSVPWTAWLQAGPLPADIRQAVAELVQIPIDVDYVAQTLPSNSHWTYDPDESKSYHRVLLRSNFCPGSRGYWTETNSARAVGDSSSDGSGGPGFRHRNEYAYPVNTLGKPAVVARICAWAQANRILPLGRWGQWEHMNSDVAVSLAIAAAREAVVAAS